MKDTVKDMGTLIARKAAKEAAAMLPTLYQAIDKAAKAHTINKNTAARMKSRAAKQLARLSA